MSILELDLQVNPGSSSTGYVSNIEGVLNRFTKIIDMVLGDLDNEDSSEDITRLEKMKYQIANVGIDKEIKLTLEFLDPHGNSMIIDKNATERDLTADELESLPVGPDPAVFSKDD